ncbi:MAG: tryptophan-rich sensory protein [Candidatus Harrisonbacteria bacterium CG10_big_fil_rev_8_21_14_0_10_44_23]|uniref:Tryptophan-rich sensory protein n=1 Tax=Candidatus Harrisonbacteria bacterium CG10_big_fil_rev_8_21_14_0_10_44_23 TaxID=1974585 RepID=A0A2H0UPK6_9BACT|nr:MAG: tryptophan-rich sensory protein [Candidatus Harrisonbacteria bacterium CG10_big_fil_rev_8_21_14_0_10_44_23]
MQTYQTFYSSIIKPFFSPPSWLFGLAWSIIYPLIMAAGIYLVYLTIKKRLPAYFVVLFAINIIANLLFTPIQLGLTALWPATIDILVVLLSLAAIEIKIYRYSKTIFWLFIPYLLWGAFATILQISITVLN